MSIVVNSTLPQLVLQVNILQKEIFYRGMSKFVPEEYWKSTIVPALYPLWDSDKDRLVVFTWYNDTTYHAARRKFIKNFKKNEFEWIDYEMEQMDNDEALKLYELFKETFLLADSLENEEFQTELATQYAQVASVSWLTIRLARNFLLSETDWVFGEDSEISDEDKVMWKKYRKALRDLPTQVTDYSPTSVKFPINPKMYKQLYTEANPGIEYLERQDQFINLGQHYLTTFKEKMVRYLIVSETTEGAYYDSFIQKLNAQPDRAKFPIPPAFTQESDYAKQLDELLVYIKKEETDIKENLKALKEMTAEERAALVNSELDKPVTQNEADIDGGEANA
jgi:hypothetical protein